VSRCTRVETAGVNPCTTDKLGGVGTSGAAGEDAPEARDVAQGFSPAAADTIFFGGGPPSRLGPEEIARIIAALEASFDIAADREVTLEANPESVSEPRLAAY